MFNLEISRKVDIAKFLSIAGFLLIGIFNISAYFTGSIIDILNPKAIIIFPQSSIDKHGRNIGIIVEANFSNSGIYFQEDSIIGERIWAEIGTDRYEYDCIHHGRFHDWSGMFQRDSIKEIQNCDTKLYSPTGSYEALYFPNPNTKLTLRTFARRYGYLIEKIHVNHGNFIPVNFVIKTKTLHDGEFTTECRGKIDHYGIRQIIKRKEGYTVWCDV